MGSKQEMMRRVAHQERLLGAARRLQPDLFRERRCHYPSDTAAYSNVDVARARQEGLEQRDSQWFCSLCDRTVEEYQVDSHMESKNHVKNLNCKLAMDSLGRRVRLGELPEWIEVRDGMEYCKLCSNYATEAHLETPKHKSRLAWHADGGVCPGPDSNLPIEEPAVHLDARTERAGEPRAVADPIPAWKLLYPGMKESGLTPVPAKPVASVADPTPKPVMARWRRIFIKEEGRSCYQDVETQVVSWQKPDEVYVECF